mgnify:CR=1 FL=1
MIPMSTPRSIRVFAFVIALTVLTMGFYVNAWKTASSAWFEGFANGTESLVIGRLAMSRQNGIFSDGGMIGREAIIPEGKHRFSYQYEIYYNSIPIQQYMTYKSNPAIQGGIFSLLDHALGLDPPKSIKLFSLLTAIISASLLSLFFLWLLEVFGLFTASMCLLLIAFSPWLTVAGGHLYWIFGTIYIPFLIPLVLLHRELTGKRLSLPTWSIGIFLAVLIKCLFTGFELITSALVMMTTPIFFYALWKRWTLNLFMQRFVTASIAGILGVVCCALLLSIQIAQIDGSMQKGWEHIQQRFLLRTYPEDQNLPTAIKDAGDVSTTSVIKTYLGSQALSIPVGKGNTSISFGTLLSIFFVFSIAIFSKSKSRSLFALTITAWISILAPLSWFVIFKSHSVMHPHLNFLAWYMPTLLLIYSSMFTYVAEVKKRLKTPKT